MISISLRRLTRLPLSLALFLAFATVAVAQPVPVDTLNKYGLYDTDRLPPSFHAGRRKLVYDSMAARSIALFMAAPRKNRANDVDYEYHQDPNFYYLTGHLEPGAALVMVKNGNGTGAVYLFVQRRDELRETWDGKRLGTEGGKNVLGFANVFHIDTLEEVLAAAIPNREVLYYTPSYPKGHHDPVTDHMHELHDSNDSLLRARYPSITRRSLSKVLAALRMVKTPGRTCADAQSDLDHE
jgi:Xaa-Pro aminopeptidase